MLTMKKMIPSRIKEPIRKLKRKLTWSCRHVTWRSRALPDFIIIGAMKSGTTSLFNYLGQHPQLYSSSVKEVKYFDNSDNFAKGQQWYRAHFPLRKKMNIGSKTYEASPSYIFDPRVPKRIFDLIPKVKIIAVLRNPTERAISHYLHEKRNNREPLSILKAFKEEEKRLEPAIRTINYNNEAFVHFSYKERGLYDAQLERYLKYFPMQQILVLSSEELFCETDNCLRQIFNFIGVDAEFKVTDLRPCNVANNGREIDADVYEYLQNYFMPHNQKLYELLGKNYAW